MTQLQIKIFIRFIKRTLSLLTIGFVIVSLLGCGVKNRNKEEPSTDTDTSSPFISTWKTTNNNEAITLPLPPDYDYNFKVDWGDGSSSEVTAHDDSDITHTYLEAGDYTLTISGKVEAWSFNNNGSKDKITSVEDMGDVGWKSLEGAFEGCSNLSAVGAGNVSNVTNMSRMFKGAVSIQDVKLDEWDFAHVTDMSEMFSEVSLPTEVYNGMLHRLSETSTKKDINLDMGESTYDSRTKDIRRVLEERGWKIRDGGFSIFKSIWRTSSAQEAITLPLPLGYIYNFTVNWGDGSSDEITAYDDSDITHTYAQAGDYTLTISGVMEAWNFNENATTHRSQLIAVIDLGDTGWKSLSGAFSSCNNLEFVSGGNVSNVTDMQRMFYGITAKRLNITHWNVSNVTNMSHMFSQAQIAQPLEIIRWNFKSVTDMENMFEGVTLPTLLYSFLLRQIHATSTQDNVSFHGGNSIYHSRAIEPRAALIHRGWSINDGGLNSCEDDDAYKDVGRGGGVNMCEDTYVGDA